ncbi:glycosyltransferase [Egicoccus halophilus]|uniref:Glycosyl transferase n=1 Tax=Egicoccus halophilus TaxID=1670830 RepID=A0A8J3A9D0_9ACTN|nr:glycosyltransferase [Egicoccus halophilus]GGI05280.1 glycosyl transferase [Egicoccus halophilus]
MSSTPPTPGAGVPAHGVPAPRVSVVIPVRNGAPTIAAQLTALAGQDVDEPFEVVVADNGSTDATVDVVRRFEASMPVRVVPAPEPGINAARNAGVRAARGQLLLFCDADDVVRPDWVARMATRLGDHDAVSGGLAPVPAEAFGSAPTATNRLRRHRPDQGRPRRPLRPPALEFLPRAVGANCAVRRDAWEAVGGFDPSYRDGGGDDDEFFWRVQLAGYSLTVDPEPTVVYRLPETRRQALVKGYRKARSSARLYAEFRPHGARFHPRRAIARWAGLLYRSYQLLRGPDARTDWLVRAAHAAGRLAGALRQRIVYF